MLDHTSISSVVDPGLRTAGICLAVDYGARHDPVEHGGLAHVLEHLLMANPLRGAESLCERVERLGGRANAETGLEQMLFHAQVLAEDTEDVLDLLLRAVTRPEHDAGVLEAEKTVVLQELAAMAADPVDVVQDAFLADLFPGHPLGRPVGGTAAQVGALDLTAVTEGHRERLLPSRAALVVVAPFTPQNLPAAAEAATGAAAPPLPRPAVALDTAPRHSAPRWADDFTWVAVGARSAVTGATERHRFQILAELFGGSPSSPLYRLLRGEKGLAYSFQAWDRNYTESGAWRVLVGADTGKGEAVIEAVTRALEEMATHGPSDVDLDAARRQARSALLFGQENALDHARLLARHRVADPAWTVETEEAALRSVTAEQVAGAARQVLDDLVVTIRPERA
ncbi:M16 family metallopeptidase [Streptomyces sp. NEAU-Y11]|uniref:M16 family metallopeptidase n=1 Tax=Streptomyces cucumeris TaxID=2962890 RepID=UPI0020C939A0|nr:pitrilysin family protein [Streptomyces sp. NEAU-Y11]MCP9206543.1 insulinase family protein [Streptomyces sp. NEAU-Y11]